MRSVLLYGSEILVVTGAMLKLLEGLHHLSAIRIAGMTVQRTMIRDWECPPVSDMGQSRNISNRGRPPF